MLAPEYNKSMELTYFIIILIVIIGGFVGLYFLQNKREDQPESESTIMLQQQIQELNRTLDTKLADSTKAIQQQFGQSAKIIADVTERLTKLDETNKQVVKMQRFHI